MVLNKSGHVELNYYWNDPGGRQRAWRYLCRTKEGFYRYFAGAEAVSDNPPESCTSLELAAGEYFVCTFEAEDFEHLVMDEVYKGAQIPV